MTGPATPALDVRGLTRRFGGLVAVRDVSFTVLPGEIFGLIGPNGAGKTTMFNMISGLIPPSSGSLLFDGRPLVGRAPHTIARRGIARTFQNIRLFGDLSVLENIRIAQHIRTFANPLSQLFSLPSARREERDATTQAMELLKLVGLAQRSSEIATTLSYGDQRRLEIARALATHPRLLLLDEPAAGMNTNEKGELSAFIKRIRDQFNLTIILIEHHVPLVMGLCDRIAVLDFGELIALGDPATVRDDPAVIGAYLGETHE
jgi:branched-chain amino acid transport system ATP-binding protein